MTVRERRQALERRGSPRVEVVLLDVPVRRANEYGQTRKFALMVAAGPRYARDVGRAVETVATRRDPDAVLRETQAGKDRAIVVETEVSGIDIVGDRAGREPVENTVDARCCAQRRSIVARRPPRSESGLGLNR